MSSLYSLFGAILSLYLSTSYHSNVSSINFVGLIAGLLRFRFIPSQLIVTMGDNQNDEQQHPWTDGLIAARERGAHISSAWTSCPDELLQIELPASREDDDDVDDDSIPEPIYLLVVEKECIFQRLCDDEFYLRVPCIMVTGCGFPDITTRALVRRISARYPVSSSSIQPSIANPPF